MEIETLDSSTWSIYSLQRLIFYQLLHHINSCYTSRSQYMIYSSSGLVSVISFLLPRSKSKKLPFLFDLKTWKHIAAWSRLSRMYFLTQMRSSKDPLYVKSIKPFCHSLIYSLCIKDTVKALIQFIFKSINQCKSRRCNLHSMWRVEVSE